MVTDPVVAAVGTERGQEWMRGEVSRKATAGGTWIGRPLSDRRTSSVEEGAGIQVHLGREGSAAMMTE